MLSRILAFSLKQRLLVLALTGLLAGVGLWSAARLPIDAVPDVTNVQVQINTNAPALSPLEVERQITYPVEVALLSGATKSLPKNVSQPDTHTSTDNHRTPRGYQIANRDLWARS